MDEMMCMVEMLTGRFFGSGVILATAVVHLLDPAIQQIGNINTYEYGGCISNAWGDYPYPVSYFHGGQVSE